MSIKIWFLLFSLLLDVLLVMYGVPFVFSLSYNHHLVSWGLTMHGIGKGKHAHAYF